MPNILIVEDERVTALDIKNILLNLGYGVSGIVDSGEEAILKAGEWRPDLVLMDIVLKKKMNGIEAAKEIWSRFAIPVVYLSAFSGEDILEEAKLTEPFGYILKPYNERELKIVLQMALYKSKAEIQLKKNLGQLKTMAGRLRDSEEEERRRLARELHDQVGQNLTALSINLNILGSQLGKKPAPELSKRLNDSQRLLEEISIKIRDIMVELRPPVLDDYGLLAALRWLGNWFLNHTGIPIDIIGEEKPVRLPLSVEITLFRVTQQGLSNVAQHAQAKKVVITLTETEENCRLTITDDGLGFNPDIIKHKKGQEIWGLITMKERIEALGGDFCIASTPGQGTRIEVTVKR